MGAQAARLLATGRLGDPAPDFDVTWTGPLAFPAGYDLDRVVRSHSGCGLAPTSYDGSLFSTVLGPVRLTVSSSGTVRAVAAPDLPVLRDVLDVDRDLSELWDACDELLPWVRAEQAGRQLRAASVFEALAQALAATNTSLGSTQAMLRELSDGSALAPERAFGELVRWGYRLPSLRAVAALVLDGSTDGWAALDDDELRAAVRALPGFGAFASASVLPLLGRPRPLVLDGWLAAQVDDLGPYEGLGRWGGEALWLTVSRRWSG